MVNLPVEFNKEDYIKDCTSGKCSIVGVLISILIPTVLVIFWCKVCGFENIWFAILLASIFPIVIWLSFLFAHFQEKNDTMPGKIEDIYAKGHYEHGVFVSYTEINPALSDRSNLIYCNYFYGTNGQKYIVLRNVPHHVGMDKKPMKCKAIIKDHSALICEIYQELEGYKRSQDFDGRVNI